MDDIPRIPKNGLAQMPPHLRRMRHVASLSAMNLRVREQQYLMHCYFSLHRMCTDGVRTVSMSLESSEDGTEEAEPFYTSEIVYFSNNPQWCALPEGLPNVSNS